MSKQFVQIGTRTYQTTRPLEQALSSLTEKSHLFKLNYLSVIKVSGKQASAFLQGQLSCDVRLVTATNMQQGALCNLKGRILALLDVINCWDAYWLVLPTDLVSATLSSLEKAAMLSQVILEPVTNIKVWGLLNNRNHAILPNITLPKNLKQATATDTYCCYQIGEHDYIILTLNDDLTHAPHQHELVWHFRELNQHRLSIYPETRGLFLPHRLNLQNTGTISFNKGCYKGQEIIARTQYRATLKHELIVTTIQSRTPPQLGAKLYDPNTHLEIGELIDYCPIDEKQHYVIACSVLIERGEFFQFENGKEMGSFLTKPTL